MKPPDINCARIVRDGGIRALGILDESLNHALVGLGVLEQKSLKLAFGRVMGEVIVELINPAIQAFPELEPCDATWASIARAAIDTRAV